MSEPLSVCQLCAVDFTLHHFLKPLVAGMRTHGWDVTCVCSDGTFVPGLRAEGMRILTVPIDRGFNPLRHVGTLFRLWRLFRREAFDVVHVHTPVAALLGRIAARLAGVPMTVYTAHGFYFHDGMRPWKREAFVALERMAGYLTHLLFTQSAEDARTAALRHFLAADDIVAIGNGVDPAGFHPHDSVRRARVRAALGIPADALVIGVIGRLVAEKGYREFLAAATELASRRQDVYFVAVGERLASDHAAGVERELAAAATALGPRLVLTGMRADVPELLTAFDIFTLPSYREGMPRTIIEAMMSALPVVATDIRGAREEVLDGVTGLLVPVRDVPALVNAFETLLDAPATRAAMGLAGRSRALELFDEARVVTRQIAEIRRRLPSALRERA